MECFYRRASGYPSQELGGRRKTWQKAIGESLRCDKGQEIKTVQERLDGSRGEHAEEVLRRCQRGKRRKGFS
jgi:hypothetical protein